MCEVLGATMFVAWVVYNNSILNKTKRKYNMTKLINGKTSENFLNIIETSAYSKPELVVSNSFTALHVAAICWELYSNTAPVNFSDEFTIHEGGDFGAYNVEDAYDMAQHYFEMAFSIGNSVKNDMQYSVQSAYEDAIGISADTCVREEVMSEVMCAIENCSVDDESIAEDYLILGEEAGLGAAKRIAKLEAELADLKAS
jgi:hypothetical protein